MLLTLGGSTSRARLDLSSSLHELARAAMSFVLFPVYNSPSLDQATRCVLGVSDPPALVPALPGSLATACALTVGCQQVGASWVASSDMFRSIDESSFC